MTGHPIGHGDFCSGGVWIIDCDRDCPICDAGIEGPCRLDRDEERQVGPDDAARAAGMD